MKRRVVALLFLSAVVGTLCAGCGVPISIESRVDPAYRGHLNRVFVVSHLARVSETFGRETGKRLPDVLIEAGVESRVVIVDPLALDHADVFERAAGYHPDSFLVLEALEKGGTAHNKISSAKVDASLFDVETETRYWRATITVESGDVLTPMSEYTSQKFCEKLVERLLKDAVIFTAS